MKGVRTLLGLAAMREPTDPPDPAANPPYTWGVDQAAGPDETVIMFKHLNPTMRIPFDAGYCPWCWLGECGKAEPAHDMITARLVPWMTGRGMICEQCETVYAVFHAPTSPEPPGCPVPGTDRRAPDKQEG